MADKGRGREYYTDAVFLGDSTKGAITVPTTKARALMFVNIGTGRDMTIKDLADIVKNTVGYDSDIRWDTSMPDGTPRKLLDISRIKELGWQPETDIETGIKMYYEWYREKSGC